MLRSETAANPQRQARALAGLAAYQSAPRAAPPPSLPVWRRHGRATLFDAGGSGRPVFVIPSLINPPAILDLPDRSLVRWLARQGFRIGLVDWGEPTAQERTMTVAAHIEELLLPLLESIEVPPVLIGYCLGGTMAWGAATAMATAGVAAIAAPWHYEGYGEAARTAMQHCWTAAKPTCNALGLVPMEVLQAGFWQLDPARTVAKYEAFADLEPSGAEARAFVRLEDWANGGAPLTFAAGAELFEDFVAADVPGSGRWQVAGQHVDPAALDVPTVEFVSTTDRIVPAAASAFLPDRREIAQGHVGMMIGRHAETVLWEPLARWIAALPPPT